MGVAENTSTLADQDAVTGGEGLSSLQWSQLVFSEDWMKRLDKMAAKRFGEGGLAEEAATYVIEQMSMDDWDKCCTFKGESNPKTYLYTLAANFLEEFSRKRFGRPRPPTWLQRQGQFWINLWKSLCLERQDQIGLIDRLSSDGSRHQEDVRAAVKAIKARIPTCGQATMEVGESSLYDADDEEQKPREIEDACVGEFEHVGFGFEVGVYGEIMLMLKILMGDGEPKEADFEQPALLHAADLADHHQAKLLALRKEIQLSDEERLVLRMVYQDGLSKTTVSKALGMASHQAGRLISSVMERIGNAFQACDIELETLLEMA